MAPPCTRRPTTARYQQSQAADRRDRPAAEQDGLVDATDGLGGALRGWRERLSVQDVGLPSYGPRRAPGLRREEVASLAGVSVDYLVRLEQGRARHPSDQVVEALGRALRLSDVERDHLSRLAGLAEPHAGRVPTRLTPGVQRMLDRFGDAPVAVLDAAWNLLTWNPAWAALNGDPSDWRGREANVVWRTFTGAASRARMSEEEDAVWRASLVGDLRTVWARYPNDPALGRLLGELREASTGFASIWDAGVVAVQAAARKRFDHPAVGVLTVDCDVLVVQGSDLRVVVITAPPGSPDAQALALLGVLGLQTVG